MNRKAQMGFGAIILATIAILVGLALYTGSLASSVGVMTKTLDSGNVTITMPQWGATSEVSSCGQKALTYTVTNATGGQVVPTTNYTFSQGAASTDGYLIAKITYVNGTYNASSVNVSCNYEPRGYVSDNGSRAIVGLIAIMFAFLIVVAALPDVRNGILDFFKG